jgi:hypothetical protein
MTEAQASADDRERPKTPEPAGAVSKLSLSDLYIQAYTNMRATDEISLKLLAAIPFVSGVGISLLVRKPTEAFPAGARLLVSLFAAVVTFVSVHLTAPVTVGAVTLSVVFAIAGALIAGSPGGWRAVRLRPAAARAQVE